MYMPSCLHLFTLGLGHRVRIFLRVFFAVQFTPSCLIAYGDPPEVPTALVFVIISSVQSAFFTFQCCFKAKLFNPDSA